MKLRAALAAMAICVVLAGCGRKGPGTEVQAASRPAPPPQVKLATAESRQIERSISVTGSLAPDESVNLSFEVAGPLARVLVDFGQLGVQVVHLLREHSAMLRQRCQERMLRPSRSRDCRASTTNLRIPLIPPH